VASGQRKRSHDRYFSANQNDVIKHFSFVLCALAVQAVGERRRRVRPVPFGAHIRSFVCGLSQSSCHVLQQWRLGSNLHEGAVHRGNMQRHQVAQVLLLGGVGHEKTEGIDLHLEGNNDVLVICI